MVPGDCCLVEPEVAVHVVPQILGSNSTEIIPIVVSMLCIAVHFTSRWPWQ